VERTIRHSPNFENLLVGPAYYLFMRGGEEDTVDQALYRQAKADGVRFHFGMPLKLTEADIAATGPPADKFNILGAGYTFSAEGSSLEPHIVHALLDNRVAPGGYLVITPGLGFHSIYSVSWTELHFEKLLEMTEVAFGIPWIRDILGKSAWTAKINGRAYYSADPIATAVQGTTLFVGEAGGFQDAIAGFGFRYAVLTGALAGVAIRDGQDYRDLLKERFGSDFHDAHQFRMWLNRATNDDFDKLVATMGREITLKEYLLQRGSRAL
jgi:flavin-dependent dehydrogenase